MAVHAAKAALRKEMKKKLASLTVQERVRQSDAIAEKLLNSPQYKSSQRVSVYMSLPEEVQTKKILDNIFLSGKTCFIPRYAKGSSEMEMVRLNSSEDYDNLPVTSWNIKQPADSEDREEALQSGGLDLILIPGLAFTPQGHRLGRGKGYYDSYLRRCSENGLEKPFTIALAYAEQIVPEIPTTDSDQNVDLVLYTNS